MGFSPKSGSYQERMVNKYFCPKCSKQLAEADVIRGVCSYCHSVFDSLPQNIEEKSNGKQWKQERGYYHSEEKMEEGRVKLTPAKNLGCGVIGFVVLIIFATTWAVGDSINAGIAIFVCGFLLFLITFYVNTKTDRAVFRITGICPYCGAAVQIDFAKYQLKSPISFTCPVCRELIILREERFYKKKDIIN